MFQHTLVAFAMLFSLSAAHAEPPAKGASDKPELVTPTFTTALPKKPNLLDGKAGAVDKAKLSAAVTHAPCAFSAPVPTGWTVKEEFGSTEAHPKESVHWKLSGEGGAMAFTVRCGPHREMTHNEWMTSVRDGLAPTFGKFVALGNGEFTFKGQPAWWLAYRASPKESTVEVDAYLIGLNRGESGMVLTLLTSAKKYDETRPLMRAWLDAVALQ